MFEEVIRREPGFALAHAGLANTLVTSQFFGNMTPLAALARATEAGQRAVALDPTSAEGHAALAHAAFQGWKWKEAESGFRVALSLNPDLAMTRQLYGIFLGTQGRCEEAIPHAQQATVLAPTNSLFAYTNAQVLLHCGRADEAIAEANRVLTLDRAFDRARSNISRALAMKGKTAEALENHYAWQRASPTLDGPLWEALWLMRLGRKEEARAARSRWEAKAPAQRGSLYAIVLLGFGEDERAFRLLRTEIEKRSSALTWMNVAPEMGEWKNDPRFKALVELRTSR